MERIDMDQIHARAVELCGLATLAIVVVIVAVLTLGADLPALRTLTLVAALSAFIVANVKSPGIALGAAIGGICFGLYWTGAHMVGSIMNSISPGWLLDVMLGLALLAGLARLAAMAHTLSDPAPRDQDPGAITA